MRRARHDSIAFIRQRYLSVFLLLVDAAVAAISIPLAIHADWWPPDTSANILIAVVGTLSVVNLLLAAGTVGGIRDTLSNATAATPVPRRRDTDVFADHRMVFYYLGVYFHIVGLALLVEVTGGLVTSPFTTYFFALVLTGQQLSRFKTQSTSLVIAGVAVSSAMFAYEHYFTPIGSGAPPPRSLNFALMALALVAGGMITNAEKDRNYLIEGRKAIPTHAHVYLDAADKWHFVIYSDRHRLDPVLKVPENDRTVGTGSVSGRADLESALQTTVEDLYQAAGWGKPHLRWPDESPTRDFIVEIPPDRAGRSYLSAAERQ